VTASREGCTGLRSKNKGESKATFERTAERKTNHVATCVTYPKPRGATTSVRQDAHEPRLDCGRWLEELGLAVHFDPPRGVHVQFSWSNNFVREGQIHPILTLHFAPWLRPRHWHWGLQREPRCTALVPWRHGRARHKQGDAGKHQPGLAITWHRVGKKCPRTGEKQSVVVTE
jgi:hypothetical protein